MNRKRYLATRLEHSALLRWGLLLAVKLFAPQNKVAAVGVVFNDIGQVLLVEHVFRPNYSWGLPGGWVNRGENPALAVQRELEEELNLSVQVKKILLCEPQGDDQSTTPPGLGLAFYCRLVGDDISLANMEHALHAFEILSARWIDPDQIAWKLLPLQHKAIVLGKQEFDREQSNENYQPPTIDG